MSMPSLRAAALFGLVASAAACAPSDCSEPWCVEPRCSCVETSWYVFWDSCEPACNYGYTGDECLCNQLNTDISERTPGNGLYDLELSHDGSTVVAGGQAGLYLSTDPNAKEFTFMDAAKDNNVWAVDMRKMGNPGQEQQVIFAGTQDAIHRSVAPFSSSEKVLEGEIAVYADIQSVDAKRVMAATTRGLWVSTDEGKLNTWAPLCPTVALAKGCNTTARALAMNADNTTLYATYENTATIFKIDLTAPTMALTPAVTDDSWCPDTALGKRCLSRTLAVFGSKLVLSPRIGDYMSSVIAYDLANPAQGWTELAVGDHPVASGTNRDAAEVSHLTMIDGALYVKRDSFIQKYTSADVAPATVADLTGDHPESQCVPEGLFGWWFDDSAPFSGNGIGVLGGIARSPNSKYFVFATNGGAWRFIESSPSLL